MPETSRREEMGQRNGSGAFGHGRHPDRSPLPRRFSALPESADDLPPLPEEFWATVNGGLATLELPLDQAALTAIDSHVRLLVAWNAAINLTSLRDPEQIARNHVLDSLICVQPLAAAGPRSVLDLGSGGGFPGLPLAATLPVERVGLVDSVGKKAKFLAVAATSVRSALDAPDASAPEIAVFAERAEDLADERGPSRRLGPGRGTGRGHGRGGCRARAATHKDRWQGRDVETRRRGRLAQDRDRGGVTDMPGGRRRTTANCRAARCFGPRTDRPLPRRGGEAATDPRSLSALAVRTSPFTLKTFSFAGLRPATREAVGSRRFAGCQPSLVLLM